MYGSIEGSNYQNLGQQTKVAVQLDRDPTVEENLDQRISMLEAELVRLREAKSTLGPLLPMKISAIRNAMNY